MTPVPDSRPALDPRVERSRHAVLTATAGLLAEGGLSAATIDAIRDRSGVSKTTIYKHWPNRLCVAVDAFAERLAVDAAVRAGEDTRSELTAQIHAASAFYGSPLGRVFVSLLAAALEDDQALDLLRRRLLLSRGNAIDTLWQRAVDRDEVRPGLGADVSLDLLFAPSMWRLVTGRPPLSESEIDRLVDAVLR